MRPDQAAAATDRYFRELPRVIHRVCGEWASKTDSILRRSSVIPTEVKRTIHGTAVRLGGDSFAQLTCESPIGLWIERGTGLYGPYKKMITAQGGAYVDPTNPTFRTRRFLRWKGTVWTSSRGGVSGQSGYIFATAVKGSPARPWFVPGIQARIPLFAVCLRSNMVRAANSILGGGHPISGAVASG